MNTISAISYSHIGRMAASSRLGHSQSRPDLWNEAKAARQEVREAAKPVIAEAYRSQQLQSLLDIYAQSSSNDAMRMMDVIKYEQKLERSARNQVLLGAYSENVRPVPLNSNQSISVLV